LANSTRASLAPLADNLQQSYACGMQVAVVLWPNLLTTEGSFGTPARIVSSAFKQAPSQVPPHGTLEAPVPPVRGFFFARWSRGAARGGCDSHELLFIAEATSLAWQRGGVDSTLTLPCRLGRIAEAHHGASPKRSGGKRCGRI
jgi:hypothetical protein